MLSMSTVVACDVALKVKKWRPYNLRYFIRNTNFWPKHVFLMQHLAFQHCHTAVRRAKRIALTCKDWR